MSRLEDQLRLRARESLLQDLGRAEELAGQVEGAVTYPEDWVIFRITGGQVSLAHPDLLKGEDLRGELSALVERLSAAARHTLEEAGPAIDGPGLCKHWGISRQTLTRLRRRGLVARRVIDARKRSKLVFRTEVVNRFQGAHRSELMRASEFSRLGPVQEARIVKRAARYQRAFKWTLNQAAARIAEKLGRSHEGIRQVLRRSEARANGLHEKPVFGEGPTLSSKQQELLYRASRQGVELSLMCRKMRRSRGAVRRAINMARARRLVELVSGGALETHAPAAFTAPGAAVTLLSPAPVRTGLAALAAPDVLSFLKQAHGQGPPIGAEEKSRLAAYQFLRFESARLIATLDRLQPSAGALDRIETMLKWAARLKAELVRSQLRVMVEALQARLGRPVEELPAGVIVRLLTSSVRAVGDAVDAFEITRGGRLAGAAGLAVDRVAVQWAKQLSPGAGAPRRATAMVPSGLVLPDWTREVAPWQAFLEPDRRLRGVLSGRGLAPDLAQLLAERFGYDGGPPRTLAELAAERKINQVAVFRLEARAVRAALALARK